jgi:hypothetical protein
VWDQDLTFVNLPAPAWAGAVSRLPGGRQARADLSRDKSAKTVERRFSED